MKKLLLLIGIIFLGALSWYLLIKPYDYLVTIKANTHPGTLNQSIKTWAGSFIGSKEVNQKNLMHLSQVMQFNDSIHLYEWNIHASTDSTTEVKVYVSDKNNSLSNRIAIPFSDTNFEKRTRKTLFDFNQKLSDHLNQFKIQIIGEEELEATYCAYTTVKGTQIEKAKGMMHDFPLLNTLLAENKVQLNGRPFLEITHWSMDKDSIEFDFCYPIIRSDTLPQHPELKYKQFFAKKAIKAIYNGNYITSDRAWYALLKYAEKNKLEITGLPIEVFHNNPNMGGNDLEWKAEIFMPLNSKNG